MSIGRRLLNMARSELNSLLDRAAQHSDEDDDEQREALHGYSARELEEELQRRRAARQEVEDAIHGRKTPEPPPPSGAGSRAGAGGRTTGAGGGRGGGAEATRIQKAYAALEVPPGSDFDTVRKAYRAMMRKYHPDHHTQSAEKQRAANEVAQRLTESYKLLEKTLRK
jgi:DnaJ-domain-containing protein 1